MTWILALFQSKIARQIGVAVVFVIGIITFGMVKKKQGADENNAKQERIDHENAANIRERVDAVDSVQDDELEYRD